MLVTSGCQEDTPRSFIVVMGATGSGKTSFINLASESKLSVGNNLKSCTEEVQTSEGFTVDGRQVVLIDTPGFHDTFKSDMDVLDSIAQSLATLYERGETLGGVIYFHRISDTKFTGTAAKCFRALLALCGDHALQNVTIVTNMWGKVAPEVGDAREHELASHFFKPALDKKALLSRHDNTAKSAHNIIRSILGKGQVILQIQEEIVDHWMRIEGTAAGRELLRELDEQVERRLQRLRELQEMFNQTETDDRETRHEFQLEILKLREELAGLRRVKRSSVDGFRSKMVDVLFYGFLGASIFLWVQTR